METSSGTLDYIARTTELKDMPVRWLAVHNIITHATKFTNV